MSSEDEIVWLPLDRDNASTKQRRACYRLWSKPLVRHLTADEASQLIEILARARGRMEASQQNIRDNGVEPEG